MTDNNALLKGMLGIQGKGDNNGGGTPAAAPADKKKDGWVYIITVLVFIYGAWYLWIHECCWMLMSIWLRERGER